MFGVKTVEALTKLGDMAGHYHRIRDALTLETLPDGSQVLGLPEQFLPQAATTGGVRQREGGAFHHKPAALMPP